MSSEIRANLITSRAGLSTVTMTDSGPMFSGITTFVDNSGFTFGVGGGTSIFTPSTNVLTFGTNNTEKIRIDASGHMHSVGVITATHFYGDGSNLTGISGGISTDAYGNTYGGHLAGNALTSGNDDNVIIGREAGEALNSGDDNVFIGAHAGEAATSLSQSVLIGYKAGSTGQTGSRNVIIGDGNFNYNNQDQLLSCTFVGYGAGSNQQDSYNEYNTFLGYGAGQSSGSDYDVCIGRDAGNRRSGRFGIFIGDQPGNPFGNYGDMTGQNNIMIGRQTGNASTSGADNTLMGHQCGMTLTTGSNNLVLGHDADVSGATVSNEITLGDTNITKFRVPGIDFILKDNGGTPTQGHVLTVDGSGEAGFAAPAGPTINNNADNRIITGSGSANTLEAEANFTFSGSKAIMKHGATTTVSDRGLMLQASSSLTNGQVLPGITLNPNTNVDRPRAGIAGIGHGSSNGTAGMHLIFMTAYRDDGSQLTSSDERLRITSGGLVGIGTAAGSSSSTRLVVYEESGNAQTIEIKAKNTGGVGSQPGIKFTAPNNDNIGAVYGDVNSDSLIFATGTTERLRIDSSGHFLPGADSAYYLGSSSVRWAEVNTDKLSAGLPNTNGSVANFKGGNYNQINIAHSSNSSWGLLITNSDSTSNGGYHYSTSGNNTSCAIINVNNDSLYLGTNNNARWRVEHDGHFIPVSSGSYDMGSTGRRVRTFYAVNSLNTSDRNLKNTITESDLGLDFICKLKPVSYKWNQNEGESLDTKTHYGLISQDVEKVIIETGKTLDDFGAIDKPDGDPMGLSYNEFISPLIKAIQDLKSEINNLQQENQALRVRVTNLEDK